MNWVLKKYYLCFFFNERFFLPYTNRVYPMAENSSIFRHFIYQLTVVDFDHIHISNLKSHMEPVYYNLLFFLVVFAVFVDVTYIQATWKYWIALYSYSISSCWYEGYKAATDNACAVWCRMRQDANHKSGRKRINKSVGRLVGLAELVCRSTYSG